MQLPEKRVRVGTTVIAILNQIIGQQIHQACPAKWNPGQGLTSVRNQCCAKKKSDPQSQWFDQQRQGDKADDFERPVVV